MTFHLSHSAFAYVELKKNFYLSYAQVGLESSIFKPHNTLLIGSTNFKVGAYIGSDQREFSHTAELEGKGEMFNTLVGKHFSKHFGLSLLFSAQHISEGMDKRWTYTLLPYLGLRTEF